MTPEELETLVLESKSGARLQEAFAPLDAAERKKLSTAAQKLYNQISRNKPNKDASDRLKAFIGSQKRGLSGTWNSQPTRNATLALYALCSISTLKKGDIFIYWEDRDPLTRIVLDRRPDWIDEWIEHDLDREFSIIEFPMLRRWIKAGACKKPTTDAYYDIFASHMMSFAPHGEPPRPPLSRQLLDEPELLDDVWGLFRVENIAFNTNSWLTPRDNESYESWTDALVKLSESGHLDRQRLLDASLEGLSLDLKQNQLSGFHKLHKRLKPSAAERDRRQGEYLMLLAHKVGHVCKFGLDMLGQIEKDGKLDASAFLGEVQAVFFQDGKGNAVAALKLIQRILGRRPDQREDALRAVIEALQHSDADVQERAIDILEAQGESLGDGLRRDIAQFSGFAAVSLKARLSGLLGEEDRAAGDADSAEPLAPADVESVLGRLSAQENKALRIGEILASETFQYLPISNDVMDQAILPTVAPLDPVQSVDELIALVSHAVEIVDSPDIVERIIDGVSRLCHERSGDFREKSAPLLHRLEEGGSESSKGLRGYGGVQLALADLLLSWLTSDWYQSPTNEYSKGDASFEAVVAHLRAITRRVAQGQPSPLLSTPSHSGGWIDPSIWVKRLQEAEAAGLRYEPLDVCFSLLRLTPDNRASALAECEGLSGAYKRIAAFALGGDARLSLKDRAAYDLWIAAARARDPYADWTDFLAPMKIIDPWPDSSEPARYHWRAYVQQSKPFRDGQVYKIPRLEIAVRTDRQPESSEAKGGFVDKIGKAISSQFETDWKKLPSAALHQSSPKRYYFSGDLNSAWVTQWLPYQWPLNPSGAYITGAKALAARIDDDSSNWTPGFGHLVALFQKNRPWREAGHLLLCLGLVAKDADARGLAVDAIVEGIESGQFDAKLFAATLADLSEGGWLKLNRLGDNLMQVIQTSPLHAWVVSRCIQLWLAGTDLKQRNLFRIVEVLLEAQSQTGQPLDEDLRARLRGLKGSSKIAKLAAKLLKLGDGRPVSPEAIKTLAVSARLPAA